MDKDNSKTFLLVLLGLLTAFGPFVTDMYLPALPAMADDFGTSSSMVQLGLTTSMIGLACGQLFFGPLSDKYGRRTPLLTAMWLFLGSTVFCIFAADIEQFVFLRFVQGIAGSGGIVISRSVATDKFSGRELAKMLALIGAINGNLSTMFGDVNEKVGTIAAEVGKTPQGWNASIFSMIQTLSENVIVPIAGLVITYVLCVELISMVTEKNNLHDIDTFMFFKWFFKAFVAVFIVTHTFDITMAVFDMAQHIVSGAAGVIGGSTSIDVAAALSSMQAGLDAMEIPELLLLMLETSLVSLCMKIMSVLITVVLYGRMIEIYLYCSVSPIPFATMTNREWGQIGNNYLKGLFALGFQGFLIMICVGIYAVLVNNMVIADNLHTAIFSIAAYTVLLCFNLLKSGALAKSLFHAH